MYKHLSALALGGAAATAAFQPASALSLRFTGLALPGAIGSVFAYGGYPVPPVSFTGQPVTLSMDIGGSAEGLYVEDFGISWSDQVYTFPYPTAVGGPATPTIRPTILPWASCPPYPSTATAEA